MVQVVEQYDPFGRIGKGFGQGLSEQLPKEIDRHRLAEGLKKLGGRQDLTPFQQFAELSSIPGITPQMVQSGADLIRQQNATNALIKKGQDSNLKSSPFPKSPSQVTGSEKDLSPSITTRNPIEATLENYIPKTFEQIQQRAGQLMEQSPQLYGNDPQKALNDAVLEEQQNKSINEALQKRRLNEQDVQNKIASELKNQSQSLGVEVPGNIYSEIEDKAINSVKPKNLGGEGLTEQQAKKKYGKELDDVSRDYKALETVGGWALLSKNPTENKRELRSIRHKFKERNDLENLADSYISKNGLSPGKAYYLAYPVSEIKDLSNTISKLPALKEEIIFEGGQPMRGIPKDILKQKTLEVSEKIAPLMGKDGSPLAIAEELRSRNYDPLVWMDYVGKNRKKLDLTERQARELDKPTNFVPTLDDLWMFLFSGLDKLVEQ